VTRLSNKQIEATRRSILDSDYFCVWPESEYPESVASAENIEPWEVEVKTYCAALFSSHGDEDRAEWAAAWIGDLIAKQLIAGNFAAPRIVSEGLINLRSGNPWKRHAGRALSPIRTLIILAFCILKNQSRSNVVSQTDVRDFLAKHGLELSRDRVSKFFDILKLGEHAGDAREALFTLAKRRQRKA
jgi:hypothetical protein